METTTLTINHTGDPTPKDYDFMLEFYKDCVRSSLYDLQVAGKLVQEALRKV
jgi:hypothetical protein